MLMRSLEVCPRHTRHAVADARTALVVCAHPQPHIRAEPREFPQKSTRIMVMCGCEYVVSGVYVSQARQLVGQDKHTDGHKHQPRSQAHS